MHLTVGCDPSEEEEEEEESFYISPSVLILIRDKYISGNTTMPTFCCVFGCGYVKDAKTKGISYHRFPERDIDRCKEWLSAIRNPKYDVNTQMTKYPHLRVCSQHFIPEDFEKDFQSEIMGTPPRHVLKPHAVPCVFKWVPKRNADEPRCSTSQPLQKRRCEEVVSVTFQLKKRRDVGCQYDPTEMLHKSTQVFSLSLMKSKGVEDRKHHKVDSTSVCFEEVNPHCPPAAVTQLSVVCGKISTGPQYSTDCSDGSLLPSTTKTLTGTSFTHEAVLVPQNCCDYILCGMEDDSTAEMINDLKGTNTTGQEDDEDTSGEEEGDEDTSGEEEGDEEWVPSDEEGRSLLASTDSDISDKHLSDDDFSDSYEKNKARTLCPDCGMFSTTSNSKDKPHVCDHKTKPYRCLDCGQRSKTEVGIEIHRHCHKRDHVYPCKYCLKPFRTRSDKLTHEQSHPKKKNPYHCPDCSQSFSDIIERNRHFREHRGPRNICHDCSTEWRSSNALERHRLVHTGLKPHICNVCQKSFSQKNNLKSHMRVHTGERPYKCQCCEKTFNHNVSLKNHIQRHHSPNTLGKGDRKELAAENMEVSEPDDQKQGLDQECGTEQDTVKGGGSISKELG